MSGEQPAVNSLEDTAASLESQSLNKRETAPQQNETPAEGPDPTFIPPDVKLAEDSPTVISKSNPKPVSSEDVLAGVLRGRRLAHFELLDPLGVGGMGAVMRATDTQLDRQVALKILPPEMALDPEGVRRFHQEARSAAKLDHENIARVFYCGEDQGLHFIAFEYVEGENLRTQIEQQTRLNTADAVNYMLQLASGIAHSASRGVVHRDIKPSNIIITPSGKAKLVDMGLARSLEPQKDPALTQSGVTLGTFDYISPEQALEPRDADARSDIYSLGCTFYHALTGHPPVPEGTAARKLHHHQNIAPSDPRQFNPDIPDELAVILGRMMAKDPADRYQQAEHLMQNLAQLSHKLGNEVTVKDKLLYHEAPLPGMARPRPALVVVSSIAAVIVLVLILGSISTPRKNIYFLGLSSPGPVEAKNSKPDEKDVARPPQSEKPEGKGKNSELENADLARYDDDRPTGESLRDFLLTHQQAKKLEILLADDVAIAVDEKSTYEEGRGGIGLLLRGEQITFRSKYKSKRPTVTLTYAGWLRPARDQWAAALTLECEKASIEGLRFRVDACGAAIAMTPLMIRHAKEAVITECSFFESGPLFQESTRMSCLVMGAAPAEARPLLRVRECYFGAVPSSSKTPAAGSNDDAGSSPFREGTSKGHEALSLGGAAVLECSDCAFGPFLTLFRIERDSSAINLVNCSFMEAGTWNGITMDGGASCDRLQMQHCLFSNLIKNVTEPDKSAVLIRQKIGSTFTAPLDAQDTCFHDVDVFWLQQDKAISRFEEFRRSLAKGGSLEGCRVLTNSPWENASPLGLLEDTMEDNNLHNAFQLRTDMAELREGQKSNQKLVGVNRCTWGKSYEALLPFQPVRTVDADRRPLIVDPFANQTGNGVYRTLAAALSEAQGGDTILLKKTGDLEVAPARLENKAVDLTIKPADRTYKPVLVLGDSSENETALFTLQDGKLQLEGLEIRLKPRITQGRGFELAPLTREIQSLVRVTGDGTFTLKDCVVTLKEGKSASLSVVRVADSSGLMKTNPPLPPTSGAMPHLKIRDCFIRGDGDVVCSGSARAFDLDVANSLAAVSGSFLAVETGKDDGQAAASAAIYVRMAALTAYLKGYLIRIKAGRDGKGVAPILCGPVTDCLFVSANNKSLVHLDGMELGEDKIKSQVQWDGTHNLYSNFVQLLDQQSSGDEMMKMTDMQPPFNWEKWTKVYGENNQVMDRVRFINPPAAEGLDLCLQTNFRPADSNHQKFGADLAQIPSPTTAD